MDTFVLGRCKGGAFREGRPVQRFIPHGIRTLLMRKTFEIPLHR